MTSILEKHFLVKKGEGAKVFFSVSLLFLTTANLLVIRAARDTIFLARSEINSLPMLYVVTAVALVFASWLYSRFARYYSQSQLVCRFLIFFSAVLFGMYFMAGGNHEWFPPFFYVLGEVIVIQASLYGWITITEQFDTRQGKRLFGLIGAGGIFSGACCGFGIQLFTGMFPAEMLLPVGGGIIILACIMVYILNKYSRPQRSSLNIPAAKLAPQVGGIFRLLSGNRYLLTLTLIFLLTGIGTAFCDYIFKVSVRNNFGASSQEMASFFGLFYGLSNSVMLIYALFYSGKVLTRLGVRGASLVLPLEILVGCVIALFAPGLLAASILKFGDTGIRYTLHNSGLSLSTMPLARKIRSRVKTFMDGMVRPFAGGMAGLILMLIATASGPEKLSPFVIFLGVVAVLWAAVTMPVKRGYLRTLYESLAVRRIDKDLLSTELADDVTIRALEHELQSGDWRRGLYALELLKEICPEKLPEYYLAVLKKCPQPEMLAELLPEVEKQADKRFFDVLTAMAESFPGMTALFARAIVASDPVKGAGFVIGLLDNRQLWHSLAVAMILYMDEEHIMKGRELCRRLSVSKDAGERLQAAIILAEVGVADMSDVADELSEDSSVEIRKKILEATLLAPHDQQSLDRLCNALFDPETGRTVIRLLREHPGAPSRLEELYIGKLEYGDKVTLLKAFRSVRSPHNVSFLCGLMAHEEVYLRRHIAVALSHIRKYNPDTEFPLSVVLRLVRAEIRESLLIKLSLAEINTRGAGQGIFEGSLACRMEIVFRCLGLLFNQDEIYSTYVKLTMDVETANALEFMDSMADWPGKKMLLYFLEDDRLKMKGEYQNFFGELPIVTTGKLTDFNDRVLQGAVLFFAGNNLSHARQLINSEYKEVSEIAARNIALQKSGKQQERKSGDLFKGREEGMLSTIEKIIFLKGVDIFGGLGNDLLLHLARYAHEKEFVAGEVICREDTLQDRAMYIIVDGRIRIEKAGREIASLGKAACFGEMALLDNKPRSASAVSLTDSHCLMIEQEALFEVISENSAIALGIIEVLTARLRAMLGGKLY